MKLYKITLFVINHNNQFEDANEVIQEIDSNKWIFLSRHYSEEADIGEWHDDHDLNFNNTPIEKFEEYFKNED